MYEVQYIISLNFRLIKSDNDTNIIYLFNERVISVFFLILPFVCRLWSIDIQTWEMSTDISVISVSYCMVCAYVRKGNPRALASELSPVHTQNHAITALLHQHGSALCKFVRYLMKNIEILLKGAIMCYTIMTRKSQDLI